LRRQYHGADLAVLALGVSAACPASVGRTNAAGPICSPAGGGGLRIYESRNYGQCESDDGEKSEDTEGEVTEGEDPTGG